VKIRTDEIGLHSFPHAEPVEEWRQAQAHIADGVRRIDPEPVFGLERPPWQAFAACAGTDVDLFFPPRSFNSPKIAAKAKALCAQCPVIDDCREFAWNEREGIWFGTTPKDRRRLRSKGTAA